MLRLGRHSVDDTGATYTSGRPVSPWRRCKERQGEHAYEYNRYLRYPNAGLRKAYNGVTALQELNLEAPKRAAGS